MNEQTDEQTITAGELVEHAAHGHVIEVDEAAERAQAVAASQASIDAARPRDPRPSAIPSPVEMVTRLLGDVYDEQLAKRPNLTPVALPLGTMAERAVAYLSGVPGAPLYHPEDTPAERFFDRRGVDPAEDGLYIPAGVIGGGLPTGVNLGVERITEGVAVPIRASGGDVPERTLELSLRTAHQFALAVLSAIYAPEPEE